MSYYYKYDFTSPEGIYATIREELRSYMDAGVIDDLMFPTYLDKCLRKLGRSTYVITETVLFVEDFVSRLPDNFYAVREAWMCVEVSGSYKCPSSFYSQTIIDTTTQVPPPPPTTTTTTTVDCNLDGSATEDCTTTTTVFEASSSSTFETTTTTDDTTICSTQVTEQPSILIQMLPATVGGGDPHVVSACIDGCYQYDISRDVYKVTEYITHTYERKYLLKPGNVSARESCDVNYMQNWADFSQNDIRRGSIPYSSNYDSFDIRDNKFVTNFRKGVVNIVFYATEYDDTGSQLLPDNHYIKEYVEAFIKYKMFEQLMNLVTDETINQIERKVQYYKQMSDEAYILAISELRKQTMWEKQRRIKKTLGRLDRYELPGDHRRNSRWRRNR